MREKKIHPALKTNLHPRSKHRERYNFDELIEQTPELKKHVFVNDYDDQTIDFSDPQAVKLLNKALLQTNYNIGFWDIPPGYLCPPIPGRADYIHHLADLLGMPSNKITTILDVGVGANCIYPIIGNASYGWKFIGSDSDKDSLASAQHIIDHNPSLLSAVSLRQQTNSQAIFKGVLSHDEHINATMCNPPFHASKQEAEAGSKRKIANLKGKKTSQPKLNFGGQSNELWCDGGEERFINQMILESKEFAKSCDWFTTLVSKESNLKGILEQLHKSGAVEVKTIPMAQGNKISRFVAWRFV